MTMLIAEKITRPRRIFLPENFQVTDWPSLKPWFDDLLNREINSADSLRTWFRHRSELEAVISEDLAWRYINMTRFTDNEAHATAYRFFVEKIQPEIAPLTDKLNRKVIDTPHLAELEQLPGYNILIRNIRKDIELFREENIPLFTEISLLQQQYNQISGAMTINFRGKELTLQQASALLLEPDRALREEVYRLITARRLEDRQQLDALFTKLIQLRHQVAVNAGFSNFRDYMFKALGRFDYTPADCFNFHDAVKHHVVPLLNKLMEERRAKMNLPMLRPWDKAVDPLSRPPLKAFENGNDLAEKGIRCFNRLHPFLGSCLQTMRNMEHLDLESRKGKAPGGYNYPLAELGVPFIFMNATSTLRDMVTLMHEGGHAVHNFLTRELELSDFKSTPSETAELASMSMELISMDAWDEFFKHEEEHRRAVREQLEDIIETLPWVATIDKFQHWIYENPSHTEEERRQAWNKIFSTFNDSVTDWTGLEEGRDYLWQKQLHLYEVPFYYIEYGMAQLGALALWRNYKKDKQAGLEGYFNALKLGNTRTIPEVYAAAGIRFDFSADYIKGLMAFVWEELKS
ncbi:MAG: M3 family oligoendopeptidase [Cyclobacteriaceae bacterium]|nr:M3 family oligoendopeptidase [Cyclobacteriaceae bacterium]MDW8331456.1 M3 family oligoendopeptidase [Cyclobacteriaceae bacterium]